MPRTPAASGSRRRRAPPARCLRIIRARPRPSARNWPRANSHVSSKRCRTITFRETPAFAPAAASRQRSSMSSPDSNAGVEAVRQERVALEDRRHEPEPPAAPPGAVVVGQRLAPVARPGLALEARPGAPRSRPAGTPPKRAAREPSGRITSASTRATHRVAAARAPIDRAAGRPAALVGQDPGAVPAGDLERARRSTCRPRR